MKNFTQRLKELREEKGISFNELGKQIGTSDVAPLNWEKGTNEPKASYIIKLANFYNVSTDYLLGTTSDFEYEKQIQILRREIRPKKTVILCDKYCNQTKFTFEEDEHYKKILEILSSLNYLKKEED